MKKYQLISVIPAIALSLAGCVAVPEVTSQARPTGDSFAGAAHSEVVCVVTPSNAQSSGIVYENSGKDIAERIAASVRAISRGAVILPSNAPVEIKDCAKMGAAYALTTKIVLYEDNYTGWSGKPDRVILTLSLTKLNETNKSRSIDFEAKSNTFASGLLEWGNAKPISLLRDDFDFTVEKLLSM